MQWFIEDKVSGEDSKQSRKGRSSAKLQFLESSSLGLISWGTLQGELHHSHLPSEAIYHGLQAASWVKLSGNLQARQLSSAKGSPPEKGEGVSPQDSTPVAVGVWCSWLGKGIRAGSQ